MLAEAQIARSEQSLTIGGTAEPGPPFAKERRLFLRLKIEQAQDGLTATLSKRGEDGKPAEPPAVFPVADKEEAKRRAKAMARALGLKTYGLVDKTGTEPAAAAAPFGAG
jgi:hypothetical protein